MPKQQLDWVHKADMNTLLLVAAKLGGKPWTKTWTFTTKAK